MPPHYIPTVSRAHNTASIYNLTSGSCSSFNDTSHSYNNNLIYSQSNVNTQPNPNASNFTSYYNNPYISHSTQVPSTSCCPTLSTNTTDITLSPSHIAARQAISKDLPNFSEIPEEWPIFLTNYITERCRFTDQENLIRLKRSCTRSSEKKVDDA